VALNGTQYPGTTPNKIISFTPQGNPLSIVQKPTIGQSLNLFPNPASSAITIETAESLLGAEFIIYNYDGKKVMSSTIDSAKQSIDISNLPAGPYWTIATSTLGTVTRTFLKSAE
jgi:hypothetical protein